KLFNSSNLLLNMNVNKSHPIDDPASAHREQKTRKKCIGNRQDQRFRKKCRRRGMKADSIEKLLQAKKKIHNNEKNKTNNSTRITTHDNNILTTSKNLSIRNKDPPIRKKSKTNLTKRKRDVSLQQQSNLNTTIPKSTSSISILQPALKKVKHKQKTITNTNISSIEVQQNTLKRTYRRPMYLKRSSKILIKMLSKTLNYTFKEKADERFIVARLDLFDRFYCLRIDLQLWESYLDIGLQQHLWPDRLYTIAKTNDFENCHQYLLNHINDLKINLDQYQMELNRQSPSCPITTLSLDQIDQRLNEFVICQRKYLLMKNNNQLLKFKDNFHDKDLFKTVSTFRLTTD
ncbi:unnamed protein product, partial [Rotaria magnacalcarata]